MNDMTNYADRITTLKQIHEKAKEDRIKAEQDLKYTEAKLAELDKQCREAGVNPNDLESEIAKLDKELDTKLREIEDQIPEAYKASLGTNHSMSGYGMRPSDFGRQQ
jgi:chromosome segregation ATPase